MKHFSPLALSALAAAATLPLAMASTGGTPSGDAARGRRVYVKKNCVECHAVMGSGGKIGPDLAEVGKGRSYPRLVAKLWEHLPLMVESFTKEGMVWPEISAPEMEDLIAYLFYLNYFDKAGDFKRGQAAFQEKRCATCHSIGGSGGDGGPALDEFASRGSTLEMVARMWSHGPAMVRLQRSRNIEIPKFQGTEIADIMAYLKGSTLVQGRTVFLRPGDTERGRAVFQAKRCSLCHAVGGQGGGEFKAPDLQRTDLSKSIGELAGTLWNHGPMVWEALARKGLAVPPFSTEEISDLVAYLYSISYRKEAGDPSAGRDLFVGRCGECHVERREEISGTPSLEKLREVIAEDGLASALWNHGPRMIEISEKEILPWPTFSEAEMADLIAFLTADSVDPTDE